MITAVVITAVTIVAGEGYSSGRTEKQEVEGSSHGLAGEANTRGLAHWEAVPRKGPASVCLI